LNIAAGVLKPKMENFSRYYRPYNGLPAKLTLAIHCG